MENGKSYESRNLEKTPGKVCSPVWFHHFTRQKYLEGTWSYQLFNEIELFYEYCFLFIP